MGGLHRARLSRQQHLAAASLSGQRLGDRRADEMAALLPVGFGLQLLAFLAFAWAYAKGYDGEGSGVLEGVRFGVVVAIMIDGFAIVWNYVTEPIALRLGVAQLIAFVGQFGVYGAIVGAIYTPTLAPGRRIPNPASRIRSPRCPRPASKTSSPHRRRSVISMATRRARVLRVRHPRSGAVGDVRGSLLPALASPAADARRAWRSAVAVRGRPGASRADHSSDAQSAAG